ncbi:hypothetical protein CAC42_4380 [Sphaceloma murrayae]|uniref:Uncharacterized protein n=1 Tax=Sphaceloma murrayae TaxID=2082308 RepID=A0A2K1QM85_9PEZI|nr:hypothetical protein CAC42_4380 [Sphaceloma murrayae]
MAHIRLIAASCLGAQECIDLLPNKTTTIPVVKRGWAQQPTSRGSIDIIWTCGFTLFLCSWSTLCLQIPGRDDPALEVWWRKLWLTVTSLIAPEISFCAAFNQFIWARRCVQEFYASGFSEWTLTHAYYADQGGFLLHTPDYPPVPLDGLQLHYLVVKGYVPMPKISRKIIMDRNKVDGVLRLITQWQTLWFLGNMIVRVVDDLHITSLELRTVAFITCSASSALFWWHKPADVTYAEVIHCDTPMHVIVGDAENVRKDGFYRYSPLEFISYEEWAWSKIWHHWINILRRMGLNLISKTPINRRHNTNLYATTTTELMFMFVVGAAYISIFFLFWHHDFPTRIELWLWRFAAVDTVVLLFLCVIVDKFGFDLWPAWRERLLASDRYCRFRGRLRLSESQSSTTVRKKLDRLMRACRNNSASQHPSLDVPLKVNIPMYFMAFFYGLARVIIAAVDIAELRLLPESAYKEARVTSIFPHL